MKKLLTLIALSLVVVFIFSTTAFASTVAVNDDTAYESEAVASTLTYYEEANVSLYSSTYFRIYTSHSKPVTIVYSLSGNSSNRYTVEIVDPNGNVYSSKIYANGGQKAKTFTTGSGYYYVTISLYSGTTSTVSANVYVMD